jgi:hypothetical protein
MDRVCHKGLVKYELHNCKANNLKKRHVNDCWKKKPKSH